MMGSIIGESNSMAATSIQETTCSIESAECDCCGLTEECTPAYIDGIRERFQGRWICGLCAEAVKDEIARSAAGRPISTEEALNRHITFSKSAGRGGGPTPSDPAIHLISAVRQLLRRSLGSPDRGLRPTLASPVTKARRRSLTWRVV